MTWIELGKRGASIFELEVANARRLPSGPVMYWVRVRDGRAEEDKLVHTLMRGDCHERWLEHVATEIFDRAGRLLWYEEGKTGARAYLSSAGPSSQALTVVCGLV